MTGELGRRVPTTWTHVDKYPLHALVADPQHELVVPPAGTEKGLGLPWWWKTHDQGAEGACVGFGCSAMMSVTNHAQRLAATGQDLTFRYAARWLYIEAQLIDEWNDTPPGEGTSVRAGCDILRDRGHRRVQNRQTGPELLEHGIAANRWAQSIDEVRAAIFAGFAVAIGVNWYANFDDPVLVDGEYWIGRGDIGVVRGGHCTALYRFSDRRQAVRMMNSWGAGYPPVWLPYDVLERLLHEDGEVAVITDR